MKYQIVLTNGSTLECWGNSIESIIEMMLKDGLFVVQESQQPQKITYILPEKVSYFRFGKDVDGVAEPR
ncbi:hypothetical protein P8825_14460 [Shouchella clausii]|uniref:hypothetical protein n=1 Tax=Shouchella clausii TaxID=79880 RepID=UPI002DBA5C20|nr:hypothetical protein [Shouchella clausii]MEB5480767.1 hypothetical protein [Shouchella clausii]